jgi:formate dehydrogenase subunit gamma
MHAPDLILRFTGGERWVHRSTAALMGVCLATAACLYIDPLAIAVGHRGLVERVHVYAGLALPLPMLLGWLSAAYRDDLSRLNRFTRTDWEWLRSRDRRTGRIAVGKFNPGQKLNAAFIAGAVLVMVGTGVLMRFGTALSVVWRTGATFVHDWLTLAIVIVLAGHLWFASRDPIARAGMRTGSVPLGWARIEHGAWARSVLDARRSQHDRDEPSLPL